MGKTSKWIRNFLTGKKERTKEKIIQSECGFTSTTPSTPKEKRRWSFRRSSATAPPACASTLKDSSPPPQPPPPPPPPPQPFAVDSEDEQSKNVSAVEVAVAVEDFAAVKIQACFRSHLVKLRNKLELIKILCFFLPSNLCSREFHFFLNNFLGAGEKSIKSIKRVGEITSTCERSFSKETSNSYT